MTALTARQLQVLAYLRAYIAEVGYAPSVREVGAALGLRSSGTVSQHLDALERKGYIRRVGPRAVRLLREGS